MGQQSYPKAASFNAVDAHRRSNSANSGVYDAANGTTNSSSPCDFTNPLLTDDQHFFGLVMPPRLPLGVRRALPSPTHFVQFRVRLHRRFASSSTDTPEIYDVVCVGGGPAGLSLLAGLKASPITNGLKVALIEGQDLQKSRLQKDASLESFSNRCSSLTPASVRNLQGTRSLSGAIADADLC